MIRNIKVEGKRKYVRKIEGEREERLRKELSWERMNEVKEIDYAWRRKSKQNRRIFLLIALIIPYAKARTLKKYKRAEKVGDHIT